MTVNFKDQPIWLAPAIYDINNKTKNPRNDHKNIFVEGRIHDFFSYEKCFLTKAEAPSGNEWKDGGKFGKKMKGEKSNEDRPRGRVHLSASIDYH